MSSLEAVPLSTLAAARTPQLAALWALAHPLGPCGGDPVPAAEDTWAVADGKELLALGGIRVWGRVAHVHGIAVAEAARGRGLGALLLDALVREIERRDPAVIGIEVDESGAAALTTLARAGFKPMQLSFILGGAVPPEDGPEAIVLSGEAGLEGLGVVRGIAAATDAALDPTSWLAERLRRREVDVALIGDGGAESVAVLPATGGGDALAVSMLLCAEGPPGVQLPRVMGSLGRIARDRGLTRIQVASPSRYWDATRALLDLGFRPQASFLRLTRQGYPERADAGRTCLATWR